VGLVFLINVPVVVIGLAAVIALVPEFRASRRPGQQTLANGCG
jgi:hypothetical protein